MSMSYILNALKAVAITVLTVTVLLFVLCCVSYGNDDPDKMLDAFGYIIFFAGAIVSGVVSGLQSDKKSIVPCIISGILYLLIIFAVSMFFSGDNRSADSTEYSFLRGAICYAVALTLSVFTGRIANRNFKKSGSKLSPVKLRKNTLKKLQNQKYN